MFKLKCSKFNDNFVQFLHEKGPEFLIQCEFYKCTRDWNFSKFSLQNSQEISNLDNLLVAANSLNSGVKTLYECKNQLEKRRPLSTGIFSAFSKKSGEGEIRTN